MYERVLAIFLSDGCTQDLFQIHTNIGHYLKINVGNSRGNHAK